MAVELYIVIEKLPERCEMTFDGAPVIIGQKYLKAQEDKFQIKNASGFKGMPLDEFHWRAEEKLGKKSQNIAVTQLHFNVEDTPEDPGEENQVVSIEYGEELILSDHLSYEPFFDRVVVDNISGHGFWMLNGIQIKEGDEIMWYKLHEKLKFICDENASQNNYAKIELIRKAGDKIISGDFSLSVNVTNLAELNVINDVTVPVASIAPYAKYFVFSIEKQLFNTEFDIDIITDIADIAADPDNVVEVYMENETTEEITTNTTKNIVQMNDDSQGSFYFICTVKSQTNFSSGDKITVTLNQVDSDSDNVNSSKNTLIFNLD